VNQIAIAIKLNHRHLLIGARWPTKRTVKAVARLKWSRLKRKIEEAGLNMAMSIIPMPRVAAVA
jgi:hypothetical protein